MTDSTEIAIIPADENVRRAIEAIAERAKSLVVADASSYEGAGLARRELATIQRQLKADTMARKRPIIDAGNAVQAEHNKLDKMLTEADRSLAGTMNQWRAAENARIAKEQEAAAAKADRERLRLEQRADKAAGDGDLAKAALLEERAADIAPPIIPRVGPAAGISERDVWTYEIVDRNAIPAKYLIPDEKLLLAVVKAEKDRCDIPGIRVFKTNTDVRRSV